MFAAARQRVEFALSALRLVPPDQLQDSRPGLLAYRLGSHLVRFTCKLVCAPVVPLGRGNRRPPRRTSTQVGGATQIFGDFVSPLGIGIRPGYFAQRLKVGATCVQRKPFA